MVQSIARIWERVNTMENKTLLSLAVIGLFAATANADGTPYTVESTNSWFSVSAAGALIPDATTEQWTIPSPGTAGKSGSYIAVDTDMTDPLRYNVSGASTLGATRIRITGKISNLFLNAGIPSDYTSGVPQAAIVAVDDTTDAWYGWHCTTTSSGEDGDWVLLSGSTPEETHDYDVVIEFKSGLVRYGIGSTPIWLTHTEGGVTDANGWMLNAKTFTAMNAIGFAGYGTFGDFEGKGFEVSTITIDTSNAALAASGINVDNLTSEKLNTVGDNGLTLWETLTLGLASTATEVYTAPVQTADSDKLAFTIGSAEVGKYGTSGTTVTFDVYECDANGVISGKSVGTPGDFSNDYTATVNVPTEVKYYKIKIKIQ